MSDTRMLNTAYMVFLVQGRHASLPALARCIHMELNGCCVTAAAAASHTHSAKLKDSCPWQRVLRRQIVPTVLAMPCCFADVSVRQSSCHTKQCMVDQALLLILLGFGNACLSVASLPACLSLLPSME